MSNKIKIYVIYKVTGTTRNMVDARKDQWRAYSRALALYLKLPDDDYGTDYIVEACEVSGTIYNDLFVR